MISEGSCETEAWSNDAENVALHFKNKLHVKICLNRKCLNIFSCNNISEYYSWASLGNIRIFKNIAIPYRPYTFEQSSDS